MMSFFFRLSIAMNSKAVTDKCRRSKCQAGLDFSPEVSLAQKKPKKMLR